MPALESTGLRDRPEGLIRELYAATGPLHAEAAPGEARQPLEQVLALARGIPAACYAVDDATGDFVGLTDIVVSSASPERVWVGNTAVEPAHRGRALGKWLKGR